MFSSLSLFVIIILQYLTILLGCTVRVGTKPCDGLLRLSLGFRQKPPANLAGVSSESLTTLARVSSARSRSPCKHGDCSLLLPERATRTLTPLACTGTIRAGGRSSLVIHFGSLSSVHAYVGDVNTQFASQYPIQLRRYWHISGSS